VSDTESRPDPRDHGLYMPGEWTEHSCCWMAWPCREGMWANLEGTQQTYADVANAIARFEPVKMLAPTHKLEAARALLNDGVEVIGMSIDDSWARDSGPNFLVNAAGELAGSTWEFNAWGGKYEPYDQDNLMGSRILELAGVREYPSKLVAEGGGITVDGEGTVITTETCFLNKNRNPGWTRAEVEAELCRTLGAEKVIWIPGDVMDTETDGHIDGIAAFIEPGRVLAEINADKTDPHYEIGQINAAALKNHSSYVNTYLANGAAIVSGYGYEHDEAAVETYRKLYPDREIVQLQINDIAVGGKNRPAQGAVGDAKTRQGAPQAVVEGRL